MTRHRCLVHIYHVRLSSCQGDYNDTRYDENEIYINVNKKDYWQPNQCISYTYLVIQQPQG